MPAIGTVLLVWSASLSTRPDLGTAVEDFHHRGGDAVRCGSVNGKYICGALLAAIPAIYIAIASVPYRLERVQAYFSPGADPQGHGFQLAQSLIAIGSGGFTGVGLMESRIKLFFLPEAHTDFIFSVICEEIGFIGAVIVLALFAVYGWRGLVAAMKAPDSFGRLLAIGITVMVVGRALIFVERGPRPGPPAKAFRCRSSVTADRVCSECCWRRACS